jgi:hypothetical protein
MPRKLRAVYVDLRPAGLMVIKGLHEPLALCGFWAWLSVHELLLNRRCGVTLHLLRAQLPRRLAKRVHSRWRRHSSSARCVWLRLLIPVATPQRTDLTDIIH